MSRHPVPRPEPDLTAHVDGIALRFGAEAVAVYPSLLGAKNGLTAARNALDMLDACLSAPKPRGRS